MAISPRERIVALRGSGCGVGEWRPEKDGIFGRYHVELVK
jgi:hypothetical protein